VFTKKADLDQPGAALRFEKVNLRTINLKTQAVAGFGAVHRIGNAAHKLVGSGVEVKEGLRTHGLHIFNRGLELIGLEVAELEKAGAMLGAHA